MLGSKKTSLDLIFSGLKIRVGLSVPVSFEVQIAQGLEKPLNGAFWVNG